MVYTLRHLLGPDLENLFFYITVRAAFAAITAFGFSIVFGPPLIRYLRSRKIQELTDSTDSATLNDLHKSKKATPTMGGLLIAGSMLTSCFLWTNWNFYSYSMMGLIACLALIGFADDYMKLVSKGKQQLPPKRKMMYLLLVIVPLCYLLWDRHSYLTVVNFPFMKNLSVDLHALYVWWAVLILIGSTNAVNLTDGLDGLATGTCLMAGGAYAFIAYLVGHAAFAGYLHVYPVPGAGEVAVACASLCGACLGFLWYNCHPAEIFMGDTGSLPLGGVIGYAAIITKQEVLLIFAGGIFVAEALSVILQVGSFKLTGKRIFRIAPLHHHFEFGGLPETKIVVRFWIVGLIMAIFALATLKLR